VHVLAIIPTADRGKATVKVRLALDAHDPRILPEMGVRVNFLEPVAKGAAPARSGVLLPASALVERDGTTLVFTVADGHAHALPVTAGATMGDQRVVEGLPAGTEVVREPPADLQDGAKLELKKPAN
jgi:hypothetical protein